MTRRAVVCLLLAQAACSVSLGLRDDTLVRCDSDADCPDSVPACAGSGLCVERSLVTGARPRILAVNATSATTLDVLVDLELLPASVVPAGVVIDGLSVAAVALRGDRMSVLIETSPQVPAVSYTLRALALRDLAGRPIEDAVVTFRGFGVSPDDAPPDLVTPPDGAVEVGLRVIMAWSGRAAASDYVVEVARDPTFTQLALTPVAVRAPAASVTVDLPSEGTYFWRVKSDIQAEGAAYFSRVLHVIEDTVYVACPNASPCAGGAGTRDQPLRRIADGIALAERLGIRNVAVAGRSEDYADALFVQAPLTLSCGWDATFASLDPAANVVTVASIDARGPLYVAAVNGVVIRGCRFRSDSGRGGTQVVSSPDVLFDGVTVSAATDALGSTLRSVASTVVLVDSHVSTFAGATSNSDPTVDIVDGAFTLERSTVERAGLSPNPVTLQATAAHVEIVDSSIYGGAASSLGFTVLQQGGSLHLDASRVHGPNGGTASYAVSLFETQFVIARSLIASALLSGGVQVALSISNDAVDGVMTNSVLVVGQEQASRVLDYTTNSGHLNIEHSSLFGGAPGEGVGPRVVRLTMLGSSTPSCAPYSVSLVNNVLASNSSSPGNMIDAIDRANTATLLKNNVFVSSSTSNALTDDGVVRSDSEFGCVGDSQGNVFVTRDPGDFFTSFAGPDGIPEALDDNVFAPIAPEDRTLARAGTPSAVSTDYTGTLRATSPPSCGAFDLP